MKTTAPLAAPVSDISPLYILLSPLALSHIIMLFALYCRFGKRKEALRERKQAEILEQN